MPPTALETVSVVNVACAGADGDDAVLAVPPKLLSAPMPPMKFPPETMSDEVAPDVVVFPMTSAPSAFSEEKVPPGISIVPRPAAPLPMTSPRAPPVVP